MSGLYIQLFSIHGLIRGSNVELGRDADTGGQVKYVLELAKALGEQGAVEKVELYTRLITDKKVDGAYGQESEQLSDNVEIVRIPCGGGRYIRKEKLWPYLDEFVDNVIRRIQVNKRHPDLVHGHYADAGYVASSISDLLGIPMIFTGHSLGRTKLERLLSSGMSTEKIEKQYNITRRIEAEELSLRRASIVVTSTNQEITEQYKSYENRDYPEFRVVPPGIDTEVFFPYFSQREDVEEMKSFLDARSAVISELDRFFTNPEKPLILSICRPDHRKNIPGLVEAYGRDEELQALANLAVFAGIRRDISTMPENEQSVLTELLLAMDLYDLYGKMAIPKTHDFTYEVPELYRIVASKKGVFVNPALTEPFGLTLIEASSCGCPFVAPNDGGPKDIVGNCGSGILVNTLDSKEIACGLKQVLTDDDLWYELSQGGVKGVREHYVWDSHAGSLVGLVDKIRVDQKEAGRTTEESSSMGGLFSDSTKLLISDIDNTLIGNDEALEKLLGILEGHANGLVFGVASGRSLELIKEVFQQHQMPLPEIVIASVGTEIYYGAELVKDHGWSAHIGYRWDRDRIVEALAALEFLELQGPEGQGPFKVSYNLAGTSAELEQIREALRSTKCHFNMIFSGGKDLDILPRRASKGSAVRYLSYKWDLGLNQIVVCGDSGNDKEMLVGSTLGVVVGNHDPELESLRKDDSVYFAEADYAAGIIEGLNHYGFISLGEMESSA